MSDGKQVEKNVPEELLEGIFLFMMYHIIDNYRGMLGCLRLVHIFAMN